MTTDRSTIGSARPQSLEEGLVIVTSLVTLRCAVCARLTASMTVVLEVAMPGVRPAKISVLFPTRRSLVRLTRVRSLTALEKTTSTGERKSDVREMLPAQSSGPTAVKPPPGTTGIEAAARRILNLVLRQGLALASAGVVMGLAGALALTGFLRSMLFGVSAVDGWTFATMATGLVVTTLFACYIPARRATRLDPLGAIKWE